MGKLAKMREFSQKERKAIYERDGQQCIFCSMGYHNEENIGMGHIILGVMHYIPRAKNGKGIRENGALGCSFHHSMMDNGNQGRREEMLEIFRNYLKAHYPVWNEEKLIYKKWSGI